MINAESPSKKKALPINSENYVFAHSTRRILVIDDTPSLLEDYKKILLDKPPNKEKKDLSELENQLFTDFNLQSQNKGKKPILPKYKFEVVTANEGKEGLALCQHAINKKTPFQLAFVDMRMPSNWNGIETIKAIDKIDKKIHFVLCTAYDDLTYSGIINQWAGSKDRILLLKKPFDYAEVWQLAVALTEKYLITEKVDQKQRALEQLVQVRTANLVQSQDNLTHARNLAIYSNQTKNKFLSNISHEILNPLNSVVSIVNLLTITKLTPEQREMIQVMSSSIDDLLAIVYNLLDLSKIETGKLELKRMPFDFKKCVLESLFSFASKARQKKIAIYYSIEPSLDGKAWGDLNRFRQIISNLLSNAIKFTETGYVSFAINISSLTSWFKDVEITIRDTGIGIDESMKSRIFEEFQRSDSSIERKQEGSGLGLPICHYLAQQMGGYIDCIRTGKEGSEFIFQLPLEFDKEIINNTTENAYPNCKKITINVIDPNYQAEPIIQFLKDHQVEYKRFFDLGTEPIRFLEEAPFALVVVNNIDIHLIDYLKSAFDNNKELTLFFITPAFTKMNPSIKEKIPIVGHLTFPINLHNLLVGIEMLERTKVLTDARPFIDSRTFSDRLNCDESNIADFQHHKEKKIRVLLADDNKINRQIGRLIMKAIGADITTCSDGVQALKMIMSTNFDLIFMDCLMPIMDGYITTKEIRKKEKNRKNIIVAMSTSETKEILDKTYSVGMDDFVKKPIHPNRIQEIIEKWIKK